MEVSKHKVYGILIHSFPLFSTTFISDEVNLMREQGAKLKLYAVNPSKPEEYPATYSHFFDETTYILPMKIVTLIQLNISAFMRKPLRYLSTLAMACFSGSLSIKNRMRTLIHFCEAIYLFPQLKKDGIRHIHAHFLMGPSSIARFLKKYDGITYSITGHGTDIFVEKVLQEEKMRDAIFTRVATQYNRNFLLSQVTSKEKPRIEVIPIGIDGTLYTAKTLEPHQEVVKILHVGRLVWQKAQHLMIEMAHLLKNDSLNFELTIVGEGPDRDIIEPLIERYQLHDCVKLVGAKPSQEIKEYYHQSDIFILSSISEGWSMVLLEAMACGLAVIGPVLNGIPEMIEDGVNGRLFEKGDATALYTVCKELILDPQQRVTLAKKGTEIVHERYLNPKLVETFLSNFPK